MGPPCSRCADPTCGFQSLSRNAFPWTFGTKKHPRVRHGRPQSPAQRCYGTGWLCQAGAARDPRSPARAPRQTPSSVTQHRRSQRGRGWRSQSDQAATGLRLPTVLAQLRRGCSHSPEPGIGRCARGVRPASALPITRCRGLTDGHHSAFRHLHAVQIAPGPRAELSALGVGAEAPRVGRSGGAERTPAPHAAWPAAALGEGTEATNPPGSHPASTDGPPPPGKGVRCLMGLTGLGAG